MLTGAAFNAVKGVFLIGDPDHKAGLTCNVDANGGTTTRNVNGIEAFGNNGIPSNWVSKSLDVCIAVSGNITAGQPTLSLTDVIFRVTVSVTLQAVTELRCSTWSILTMLPSRTWEPSLSFSSWVKLNEGRLLDAEKLI